MSDKRPSHIRFADRLSAQPRLILGLLLIIASLYLALNGATWGGALAAVGLYLIWDYLRQNGIWLAFNAFRHGDMAELKRHLADVRWPSVLNKTTRAYYHWMTGVAEIADGRYAAAKVHLLVAATGELKTENDRSLVQCLLAETSLLIEDRSAAREHLRLASALTSNDHIQKIISRLQQQLDGS